MSKENTRQWITEICVWLSGLGALLYILHEFGIKVGDLRMNHTSLPDWLSVIFGFVLFAFLIAITIYRIYLAQVRPRQLEKQIEALKQAHSADLLQTEQRITTGLQSEISRAYQIRDIALDEKRNAEDKFRVKEREVEELKKCYYCPPGILPVMLEPTNARSRKQYIVVTNKGKEDSFHGQCRVLSESGQIKNTFDLRWDFGGRDITLYTEQSCKLLIAFIWDDSSNNLRYIRICQTSDFVTDFSGPDFPLDGEWARWAIDDREDFCFHLEITIFGKNTQTSRTQKFILRPGTRTAMEMLVDDNDKAISRGNQS